MRKINKSLFIVICGLGMGLVWINDSRAESSSDAQKGIRYRKGKDVNFEELLIQGDIKRPEISIVTGNASQGTDGLLSLRENFLDRMSEDTGEANE